MALTDIPWNGGGNTKCYLQSGFTSVLKTSQSVSGITSNLKGVNFDGTHTPIMSSVPLKMFLLSGQFTTVVLSSVTAADAFPFGISSDAVINTPWTAGTKNKFMLQSGQFGGVIKTSESGDLGVSGISFDSNGNTPWTKSGNLLLQSGQFTSVIKTSLDLVALDNTIAGISWTGVDTIWQGNATLKIYLQSGQFTTVRKTSVSISAIDSATGDLSYNDINARLGIVKNPIFMNHYRRLRSA